MTMLFKQTTRMLPPEPKLFSEVKADPGKMPCYETLGAFICAIVCGIRIWIPGIIIIGEFVVKHLPLII